MFYHDDSIQLSRYRNLVEALCAKHVEKLFSFTYAETICEPIITEEPCGVRISLHDVFCDSSSDALFDVHYEFFVSYAGRFTLKEFVSDPVASVDFPWEGGDDVGV